MYSGTRNYSFEEITGWLKAEGFGNFSMNTVPPARQTSIITGVKVG